MARHRPSARSTGWAQRTSASRESTQSTRWYRSSACSTAWRATFAPLDYKASGRCACYLGSAVDSRRTRDGVGSLCARRRTHLRLACDGAVAFATCGAFRRGRFLARLVLLPHRRRVAANASHGAVQMDGRIAAKDGIRRKGAAKPSYKGACPLERRAAISSAVSMLRMQCAHAR